MRNKFTTLFLFFVFLASFTPGQEIHSFMNPMGSLENVAKGNFSSTDAGFTIALPREMHGFNGTRGIQYNWRLSEGYYFVGIEDNINEIENTQNFESETDKAIDNLFNNVARDLFATKYQIISRDKKAIDYQAHQGLQVRLILNDTVCLIRIFWIKNRAYKMAVLLTEAQKQFEAEAIKVFDSLKILSKDETDKIFQNKIEEITPQPLPQSPVAPKAKSDAEDENLKGRVKYILQESRYLKGEQAGTAKQKDSEHYFNESGNYTKRIGYDDTTGSPFQIRVYGYLDGYRVEKYVFIHLETQPPPIMAIGAPAKPSKRDLRYSQKLTYEYDPQKRLKVVTVFENDGSVWTKSVYSYKENSVETVIYQDNGKLSTKSVDVLDSGGRPLESTYFGFYGQDWEEKSVYTYNEFDKQGNWTKRTTTFFRNINGQAKEQWVSETSRTILYY